MSTQGRHDGPANGRARVLTAVTALAVAALTGVAAPAVGSPAGAPPWARARAAAAPAGMTTVVVTLRGRADLSTLPKGNRAARLRAVENRLRAHAAASQKPLRARLAVLAAKGKIATTVPLWSANAVSVTATPDAIAELTRRADVESVVPDAITIVPASSPSEANLSQVRAPEVWADGFTGTGVVVATLDSGVDATHPDLSGRWRGGTNSWFDPYGQHSTPADLTGHGTGTMGVIVGGDAGGSSIGVAPGAKWIAARIFDDRGASSVTAVHQAFQWVLDPDGDPATLDAPQVVNGSWTIGAGPTCDLTFAPDVHALREAGILPIFAAGNFGPGASTSASPANYPESFAVGAVDGLDRPYASGSAGPSTCGGRTRAFPDVVAPGVSIWTDDRWGGYQTASGTSLATPSVAGSLALLLGATPGLTADQQAALLSDTAVDVGVVGVDERTGHGRIDVRAAQLTLPASPPPAPAPDFSLTASPGAASVQSGGSATYAVQLAPQNGFDGATSLSVTGLSAPGATATFAPASLGSGAWGSSLTLTTSSTTPAGSYPFTITATSGSLTRTVAVTLTVTAAPADFSVALSPSAISIARGSSADVTVSVGATGGFNALVVLNKSGVPSRTSASWSTRKFRAPGNAVLHISTTSRSPKGTHQVVVTATSGAVTRQVVLQLTIT